MFKDVPLIERQISKEDEEKLTDPFNSKVTTKYIHILRLVYSSHIWIRLSFFQISLISRKINKRVERTEHLYFPILKLDGSCFLASMFIIDSDELER